MVLHVSASFLDIRFLLFAHSAFLLFLSYPLVSSRNGGGMYQSYRDTQIKIKNQGEYNFQGLGCQVKTSSATDTIKSAFVYL